MVGRSLAYSYCTHVHRIDGTDKAKVLDADSEIGCGKVIKTSNSTTSTTSSTTSTTSTSSIFPIRAARFRPGPPALRERLRNSERPTMPNLFSSPRLPLAAQNDSGDHGLNIVIVKSTSNSVYRAHLDFVEQCAQHQRQESPWVTLQRTYVYTRASRRGAFPSSLAQPSDPQHKARLLSSSHLHIFTSHAFFFIPHHQSDLIKDARIPLSPRSLRLCLGLRRPRQRGPRGRHRRHRPLPAHRRGTSRPAHSQRRAPQPRP